MRAIASQAAPAARARQSAHKGLEHHLTERIGWVRAAVLGANDGIVSTASLLIGVAAANAAPAQLLLTGVAGLVAGAMSMAAGEYVSVHSQRDAEQAELARERAELQRDPASELLELTTIYVGRGLTPDLAAQVARALSAKDALAAHARDELGITEVQSARPVQAALASAACFAAGAALPLGVTALAPSGTAIAWIAATSLVFLAGLGGLAAVAGGAPKVAGAWRVAFWGALAMGVTAATGRLFGTVV
jgi:VIT1/CCC1 family predicted Fe2+/Mn2+ transporter